MIGSVNMPDGVSSSTKVRGEPVSQITEIRPDSPDSSPGGGRVDGSKLCALLVHVISSLIGVCLCTCLLATMSSRVLASSPPVL